jgi:hypothetical protein
MKARRAARDNPRPFCQDNYTQSSVYAFAYYRLENEADMRPRAFVVTDREHATFGRRRRA